MVSPEPTAASRPPDCAALAGLLGKVLSELIRLQADGALLPRSIGRGPEAARVEMLRSTLGSGSAGIRRRLEALGFPDAVAEEAPPSPRSPQRPAGGPDAALKAFRPCFDLLSVALRESRRISDPQTMAVLRNLILRLEAHLWLFDLPVDRRIHDWGSVNLFSLC
jgi:hypothetical protein